jgi:hypothetical protein
MRCRASRADAECGADNRGANHSKHVPLQPVRRSCLRGCLFPTTCMPRAARCIDISGIPAGLYRSMRILTIGSRGAKEFVLGCRCADGDLRRDVRMHDERPILISEVKFWLRLGGAYWRRRSPPASPGRLTKCNIF